ncbi:MAG: hypothetical protein DRJ07_06830 [Bacteroidetes bacterium]|nr:MAG: hypothetical protein DRJ07_06830 [Bacteroidota bacterium]
MIKLIKYLLVIIMTFSYFVMSAQETTLSQEKKDSTVNNGLNVGNTSIVQFQNLHSLESELEHQKLLRNIFAASFIFLFASLMFIIFFYGSKVKKINELINVQNEYMNSAKDQLQKIIAVFNYIDQLVFITNSKGVVEWTNSFALKVFKDDFENNKVNLLNKFSAENQGVIFQSINNSQVTNFTDNIFESNKNWKMIPITNSKGEFSNIVFVGY